MEYGKRARELQEEGTQGQHGSVERLKALDSGRYAFGIKLTIY